MITGIPLLILLLIIFAVILLKLRAYQRHVSRQIQENLMARQQIVNRLGIERMRMMEESALIDLDQESEK